MGVMSEENGRCVKQFNALHERGRLVTRGSPVQLWTVLPDLVRETSKQVYENKKWPGFDTSKLTVDLN